MSVLPPGATNSNVPPWATASSPVAHPVSSVDASPDDASDTPADLTAPPGLRVSPAGQLVSRNVNDVIEARLHNLLFGNGRWGSVRSVIARRSVSTGSWWLTHTAS